MKRVLIILVTVVISLGLIGCGGPKTYDEISFDKLDTMIKEKEDFILFIGAESCSACQSYKVTINKLVEDYKVDIKYIDNDKLSESEYSTLMSNFYFTATPTTVFVKNGKEENRMVGNKKYSVVKAKLKEKGYIK